MVDLNALLVFAAVVQAGGFSAASRQLEMPVSSVSRQVARLEDQFGVRLIERSTRSFRLTELGNRIFEQACQAVAVSEAVDRMVADQATGVTGLLRLLAPSVLAASLMTPVMAAFSIAHPDVRLQLSISHRLPEEPMAQADLMLRLGAMKDSSLVALKVLRFRERLVASPDYLTRWPSPRSPADLSEHRLLTTLEWPSHRSLVFRRSQDGAQETITTRPYLATDDTAGLVGAVVAGTGIGVLSPLVRSGPMQDGNLVEVLPEWQLQPVDLFLVHLGRRHVPRPVELFKEMAAQMIPNLCRDRVQ